MPKYLVEMDCPYSEAAVVHAVADLCGGTIVSMAGLEVEVLDKHDNVVATITEVHEEVCPSCSGRGCYNCGGRAKRCEVCKGKGKVRT